MSLVATALDVGFARRVVARAVDLALAPGDIVALLGPNGSGKTTLLRTLLGLLPPRAGGVLLDGRRLAEWPPRERARRLAYVPQAAESYFDFSLREMVELGRTAHRGPFTVPSQADRSAAAAALERVGLAALADRPIHRVSGGEGQLALVARALATGATHLLMDEPTANLDYGNQARVLEEMARLAREGVAVLFSTHQPDHALRVAHRAVLLRDGSVLAAGPARDTLTSATLSSLYGRPVEALDVAIPGAARQVRVVVPRDGMP